MDRLDKLFSNCLILSRNDFKKAVRNKRIKVNNEIITSNDIKVDEFNDEIKLDEKVVNVSKYIYIMLNKPIGIVSSTMEKNEVTVLDILPKEYLRKDLFPCGRLDKDTTGLLIITNDGESAHKNLSPKKHVDKTYYYELELPISNKSIEKLENGVTLNDGLTTKECKINPLSKTSGYITISEGKYHEIRRMFAYASNKVITLKRISFGDIKLDESLKEGESRLLTKEEIEIFKREYE